MGSLSLHPFSAPVKLGVKSECAEFSGHSGRDLTGPQPPEGFQATADGRGQTHVWGTAGCHGLHRGQAPPHAPPLTPRVGSQTSLQTQSQDARLPPQDPKHKGDLASGLEWEGLDPP